MSGPRTLVVLTGHTRGLGAALADRFLDDPGCDVIGLARTRTRTTTPRWRLTEHLVDLADPIGADAVLGHALAQVDLRMVTQAVLVHNAGLLEPVGLMGTLQADAMHQNITVDLIAPLVLTNTFLRTTAGPDAGVDAATRIGRPVQGTRASRPSQGPPAGRSSEGTVPAVERRIGFVSSGAGRTPYAGWAAYCAAKAGLDHLARVLALEAPPRCRVASIAPGVIDTDMQATIRASRPEDFPIRERFERMHADGLLAAPDDVASRLVTYLMGPHFGDEPVVDLRAL